MRFGILGPLAVWAADGSEVTVRESKVRALLAVLLLHEGQPVSVERLCSALWTDVVPNNVTGALHTKVWQLRRTLEAAEPGSGACVVSNASGYLLRVEDSEVDARQFFALAAAARAARGPRARATALGEALALWRGPVLGDLGGEALARAAVVRLEEERLAAVEDRAEALLELGEHRLLVGELADLVAGHPLRERPRAMLMRALYRSGRQSEALESFDSYRRHIADHLGLEPGPELVVLRQAVLQRDPGLDPAPTPITTAARPLTNIPAQLTPLIGREGAAAQVRALLETNRLVTLNGIGGVGKTRLALAVAEQLAGAYPDGTWLVELAPLAPSGASGPAEDEGAQHEGGQYDSVAELVMTALDVRDESVRTGPRAGDRLLLANRLADALRTRRMLLVLDNCEHLVEPVARLSELLLKTAPGLCILATSQEPLGVAGEQLWTVPPLVVPDDVERLNDASAVELFVTRASALAPGMRLDEADPADLLAICRRLDGIPLALELAATRVRALGVREVASRLEDRFGLLTVGSRGAPPRQQTLRAAIAWSWGLLGEQEQKVLRRLSVQVGGCDLQAAEEVCAGAGVRSDEVLDLVARLVDRSLVAVTHTSSGPRYRLLESVAAYCAQRLSEAGEHEWVRERYVRYYQEFAQRAQSHLRGSDQRHWLERLDAEAANLRNVLDIAVASSRSEVALRCVNAMAWYWFLRGRLGEANRSLTAALSLAGGSISDERTVALSWRAGFALRGGDNSFPREEYDRVWQLCATITDPHRRADARWFLSFAQIGFGDRESREERVERAWADFRALGDRWGIAAALSARAVQAMLRGDLDTAHRSGTRSVELYRELGDGWGQLQGTNLLAQFVEIRGDYSQAARLHRDGLRIAEVLGLWNDVAIKLAGLGRVALLDGDYPQARELHQRAMRLAAEQNFPFGEQFAEVGLGMVARREGRFEAAKAHLLRWLDWCRLMYGEAGAALILAELGFVAEQSGDAATARRRHLEAFAAARATRDPRAAALALEGLAGARAVARDHHGAAVLLGSAETARAAAGAPLPRGERGDVDRITALVRAGLGAEPFEAAVDRGRGLPPEQAVAEAPTWLDLNGPAPAR